MRLRDAALRQLTCTSSYQLGLQPEDREAAALAIFRFFKELSMKRDKLPGLYVRIERDGKIIETRFPDEATRAQREVERERAKEEKKRNKKGKIKGRLRLAHWEDQFR